MSILLKSFLKNPTNTCYDGADQDENILYVLRRSFITNFDWMIIAILLLITPFVADTIFAYFKTTDRPVFSASFILVLNLFWYLFTCGYVFQNFLNWFFNVYIITNKKIVDVDFHGILHKNISESPLRNIEDVTSTVSGALRVIFNYGSVFIQTSAEKREFEFEDLSKPSKVRDIIADLVMETKKGHQN